MSKMANIDIQYKKPLITQNQSITNQAENRYKSGSLYKNPGNNSERSAQ